jgi:hypothetical protein
MTFKRCDPDGRLKSMPFGEVANRLDKCSIDLVESNEIDGMRVATFQRLTTMGIGSPYYTVAAATDETMIGPEEISKMLDILGIGVEQFLIGVGISAAHRNSE